MFCRAGESGDTRCSEGTVGGAGGDRKRKKSPTYGGLCGFLLLKIAFLFNRRGVGTCKHESPTIVNKF